MRWFHWLIILGSLIVTVATYQLVKHQVEQKNKEWFEHLSTQTLELIHERMSNYEDALWAGVAVMESHTDGVDYKEWNQFVTSLRLAQRYPGVSGIGIIYYVPSDELADFLAEERALRPDYSIHPIQEKTEYWPIAYIEPNDNQGRSETIGLDIAYKAARLEAAKRARDTGSAQITGPLPSPSGDNKTSSFLFYAPFYKGPSETLEQRQKNLAGLVYAPFTVSKLMEGPLGQEARLIDLTLSDSSEILYQDHHRSSAQSAKYKEKKDITKYGRRWHYEITSCPAFERLMKDEKPIILLRGGLIINVLLVFMFILLSNSNKHAIALSEKTTAKYQRKVLDLANAISFQETVLNNIPEFVVVKDENFKTVLSNSSFLNIYPENMRDKVIGHMTMDAYDKEGGQRVLKQDKAVLEQGFLETHETLVFPDGERRTVHIKKTSFEDVEGNKFILSIARDITAAQETEKALLKEKAYNEFIVSNIPFLIFEISPSGTINRCNKFAKDLIGMPDDEQLIGQDWFDIFDPPFISSEGFQITRSFKSQAKSKDGETIEISWNVLSKHAGNEAGKNDFYILIGTDMTEHTRSEEVLRQNQKMQSLGYLSGGIAHEINNFLQPSLLSAELLKNTRITEDKHEKHLDIIVRNITAAKDTVKNVLKFSRQEGVELSLFPFGQVIEDSINFAKNLVPSTVNLHINRNEDFADFDKKFVRINENDLIRVFTNLLKNAVFAIEQKGDIYISYRIQDFTFVALAKDDLKPGVYGVFSMQDTGNGIAEENIGTIFDPFFTTKPVGEGTGLGLSSVYGIVKDWGGEIMVENMKEGGAKFTILIPISDEETV